MSARSALQRYALHAERYGVDGVFETARDELEPGELGLLALRLRKVAKAKNQEWNLPATDRAWLIDHLLSIDTADRRVCDIVGISRQTLWRHRQQVVEGAEHQLKHAFQSGGSVSNHSGLGVDLGARV